MTYTVILKLPSVPYTYDTVKFVITFFVLNPLFLTNKYEVPIISFNSLVLIILLPRDLQGPFQNHSLKSQLCPVMSSLSLSGLYSVPVIKNPGRHSLLTNRDRSTKLNTYLSYLLLRFSQRCLYSGTFTNNKIFLAALSSSRSLVVGPSVRRSVRRSEDFV